MSLSFSLLLASGIFYGAAFLFHLASFFGGREKHRPAFTLMRIGFLFSTFFFMAQAVDSGFFLPVANFSQAMAFFAWSLAFVYLVLLVRIQTDSFGLVLSPILAGLIAASLNADSEVVKLPPMAANPYFKLHVLSAFFAYAAFTISFAAGLLYLIQHHELKTKHAGTFYQKLPSLEDLEKLIYQPVGWGAPLLALALAIGFLWSKSAYGEYWVFDPKTILTALTLFLYGAILFFRRFASLGGKRAALLSLIAFGFVLFSFVGMHFIHSSHHFPAG